MITHLLINILPLLLTITAATNSFYLKSPEFSIIKIHKNDDQYIRGLEIIKFTGSKYESKLVGEKSSQDDVEGNSEERESIVRMRSDVPLCFKFDDDGLLIDITATTTSNAASKEECDEFHWFPMNEGTDETEIGKRPSGVKGTMVRRSDGQRVIGSIEIEW